MNASTMPTGSDLEAPYAHGYLLGLSPEPLDVTGISASSVFGNGNLVATARDVALFFGALARGEVVGPRQLPAMFTPRTDIDTHYGMGVWRFDDGLLPCGRFVGHDGGAPGYDVTAFSSPPGTWSAMRPHRPRSRRSSSLPAAIDSTPSTAQWPKRPL